MEHYGKMNVRRKSCCNVEKKRVFMELFAGKLRQVEWRLFRRVNLIYIGMVTLSQTITSKDAYYVLEMRAVRVNSL